VVRLQESIGGDFAVQGKKSEPQLRQQRLSSTVNDVDSCALRRRLHAHRRRPAAAADSHFDSSLSERIYSVLHKETIANPPTVSSV
jgi:hypothetical protein